MPKKPPALSRADIADAIRRNTGLPILKCAHLVDDITDRLGAALIGGEDIKIPNFGTFLVQQKEARIGRNPRNGDEHAITARRVVKLRASGKLNSRVQGGYLTRVRSKT